MFEIIYMKADYEPWWQFDGWQEHIVSTETFDSEEEFKRALGNKLELFRLKYPFEKIKDESYYAFWTDQERDYCVACEDDIQIYHGIIVKRN